MPEPVAEEAPEPVVDEVEPAAESVPDVVEPSPEPPATEAAPVDDEAPARPSKGFDPFAGVKGFFGTVVNLELEPEPEPEPAPPVAEEAEEMVAEEAEEPVADTEMAADTEMVAEKQPEQDTDKAENPMQTRLEEVRAKADEARIAKLQSVTALHDGLGAAYDFALDAEDKAEEYLKLVETKGLKIQLRSPMAPVVRLAFDGLCDEATIAELEGVMAWALRSNLPRGSLAERIQAEGGLAAVLSGPAREG
jgi:hypothetical protein